MRYTKPTTDIEDLIAAASQRLRESKARRLVAIERNIAAERVFQKTQNQINGEFQSIKMFELEIIHLESDIDKLAREAGHHDIIVE